MKAIRKDTFREIKGTLGRFFSIMLLIMLGVAFFVGLRVTSIDMQHTADSYLSDTNFMDFRLISTVGFQAEDIQAVKDLESIKQVTAIKQIDAKLKLSQQDVVVRLFGLPQTNYTVDKNVVNQPVLLEGRMPKNENEVVVDIRGKNIFHVQIGDTLHLKSGTEEKLTEKISKTQFQVVGFIKRPDYLSLERGTSTIGNGKLEFFLLGYDTLFQDEIWHEIYVTVQPTDQISRFSPDYEEALAPSEKLLQQLGETRAAIFKQENIIEVREKLAEQKAHLASAEKNMLEQSSLTSEAAAFMSDEQLKAIQAQKEQALSEIEKGKHEIANAYQQLAKIPEPEWLVLNQQQNAGFVEFQDSTKSIEGLSAVFPVFLFLVAALVCLTTMARMVGEQRSYIGTLKALGYGKFSIAMKYITYSISATLIGSVFGSLIGTYLLPEAVYTPYQNMFSTPELQLKFDWFNVLFAVFLALIFTVIPTIFSCVKELKENAASLLRPKVPPPGRKILMERLPFIWRRFSFIYKVTFRNIFRYKRRLMMTVFGISGCTALLVLGFGLKDSIGSIIIEQYDRLYQYQMTISLTEHVNSDEFQLKEPGIEDALYVSEQSVDISSDGMTKSLVMTVPKQSERLQDYILLQNRKSKKLLPLTDEGVILTEKMANILGIKQGDSISLQITDTKTKVVKVTGIAENYFYHHLYMTPNVYKELFEIDPVYSTLLVKVSEEKRNDSAYVQELTQKDEIASCAFLSSSNETMDQLMKSLNSVVWILIFSAGLLAFIVLYNLTNVNISERVREIATIKVLGFYHSEVGKYIFRENIILTVLGTIFGLFLGILLHNYTLSATEMDYTMFPRIIQNISYVYATVLTLGFSFLVNFVMYFKLKRIHMVESLKSVE